MEELKIRYTDLKRSREENGTLYIDLNFDKSIEELTRVVLTIKEMNYTKHNISRLNNRRSRRV